ncbi:MAG: phosphoethanolamine N-methyltransferase [Gammaproteobacteria bacterium]|jgi:phosphoethanolamine N-methyltransferase
MVGKQVTQEVLDSSQYTVKSIQHYETVFGVDFVSPGGYELAFELLGQLNVEPGSRVLDVGSGLGGSAFMMAREFGLIADGIDLSSNMLTLAKQKLEAYGLSDRVSLELCDCLELDRPTYYDAIYSRDVFLHIADKNRLFSALHASLKPGGKLLFTDYCCGAKPWADSFSAYVESRGYSLHTLPEYADLMTDSGFRHVEYVDMTERFIDILNQDLQKIDGLDFTESVRSELKQSWHGKLERAKSGDHRWGLFSSMRAS